jgi:soluble lytic murein transglycosylase-like protein
MKISHFKEFVTVLCVFLLGVVLGLSGFSCSKKISEAPAGEVTVNTPEKDGAEFAEPLASPGEVDLIQRSYRNAANRERVVDFFAALTGSAELAAVILANADIFGIPPALAFSLCWEESRYNPKAVNRKNRDRSVDRGLFQLNSLSFPDLKDEDFFDADINARYGLSHLRWCLDNAGTEVAALAMYNAGTARVRSGGTPHTTLDYISRILKRQRGIEESFAGDYSVRIAAAGISGNEERTVFRLSLLAPLGGR